MHETENNRRNARFGKGAQLLRSNTAALAAGPTTTTEGLKLKRRRTSCGSAQSSVRTRRTGADQRGVLAIGQLPRCYRAPVLQLPHQLPHHLCSCQAGEHTAPRPGSGRCSLRRKGWAKPQRMRA